MLVAAMLLSLGVTAFAAYPDPKPLLVYSKSGKHISDLITVASTQIGYVELDPSTGKPLEPKSQVAGYTKYGESFDDPRGEWCAYFVSWCATKAGIPTSIVPRLGNCARTVEWYKNNSVYKPASSGYIPKPGDIIFFNWQGGSEAKHIGIVTGVNLSKKVVFTIEGNTGEGRGNQCMSKERSMTAGYIVGYGVPAYNDAANNYGSQKYPNNSSQSGSSNYAQLSVITTSATDITATNAILHGEIKNNGKFKITSAGFLFGTDKTKLQMYPVTSNTTAGTVNLELDIASKVGELTPNTTYYYRSFVRINGTDYPGPMYAVVTFNDQPQQLMLSEISTSVGLGQTNILSATPLPYGTVSKGIVWKSSDTKIATVTNEGVVKGISYGTAKLTATTNYGSVSAACNITVLIPSPEKVKATSVSENDITVSWASVKGAEGYAVYRKEDNEAELVEIAKLDSKTTSFEDTTVEAGKKYRYRVITLAKSEIYNSKPSEEASATAKLGAPAKISAAKTDNWITISWDTVEGAERYYIYRATSENGAYVNIGKAYDGKFVDRLISADCTYYYKVFADNGNTRTQSDFSPVAAITTKVICLEKKGNKFSSCEEEKPPVNGSYTPVIRPRIQGFNPEIMF